MSFRDALAAGRVLTVDGGTGSELRRRGLELSDVCWSASVNLEHGMLLEAIHRDYVAAGADIVTANTFGTTRFVLEAAGLGDRFEAANRAALRAAFAAAATAAALPASAALTANSALPANTAGRRTFVAASLSCMPPRFDRSAWPAPDVEYDAYRELADLFAGAGVDLVLVEMLQSAPHALRACRAVRETGLPFVAGLSCRFSRASDSLVTFDDPSTSVEPVLETVLEFAPDAIAIMHTPLDAMLPALDLLQSRWQGPVGAYAEIPYPEDPERLGSERPTPASYAAAAKSWTDRGARIVGGCCGTTPEHIAALTSPLPVG